MKCVGREWIYKAGTPLFRVLGSTISRKIQGFMSKAALSPTLERYGLLPESQHKPADIYTPSWLGRGPCAFDVTIRSPFAQGCVNGAAAAPGYVAQRGEEDKRNKYETHLRRQGIQFEPLLVLNRLGDGERMSKRCLRR